MLRRGWWLSLICLVVLTLVDSQHVDGTCRYNLDSGNSSLCGPWLQTTLGLMVDTLTQYDPHELFESLTPQEKAQVCTAVRSLPLIRHKCCAYFEEPCGYTFANPSDVLASSTTNTNPNAVTLEMQSTIKNIENFLQRLSARDPNMAQAVNAEGQFLQQALQQLQGLIGLINPGLGLNPGVTSNGIRTGTTGTVEVRPTNNGVMFRVEDIGSFFGTLVRTFQDLGRGGVPSGK